MITALVAAFDGKRSITIGIVEIVLSWREQDYYCLQANQPKTLRLNI